MFKYPITCKLAGFIFQIAEPTNICRWVRQTSPEIEYFIPWTWVELYVRYGLGIAHDARTKPGTLPTPYLKPMVLRMSDAAQTT